MPSNSGNLSLGNEIISAAGCWPQRQKLLMSQMKERLTLSCGSERPRGRWHLSLILTLQRALGKRLGTGCISDRGTSIGKGGHGDAGCIEFG